LAAKKKKTVKKPQRAQTPAGAKQSAQSADAPSDTATPPHLEKITRSFPIVGLGASAGGLEALEVFFRCLPADSGMAYVVVMHQAAKHVSLLPELLSKCTKMVVAPIQNQMKVQRDAVYIVPPGKNVDLLDGTLHLSDLPEKHVAPLPIDHFFRSLAADRRELAVAIVLSGTGTDGTMGLSAIKGESGMVMVQSIESAKFSGMPQHAIAAHLADYVLAPADMPAQLIKYARGPFLKEPPSHQKPAPVIQQALPEILLKLRRRCGHDFSGYKTSTICRRVERRMNVHQIADPKSYLKYLDQHEPEAEWLFRDLLIGVTSFFRDPWAFEALSREAIMPMLQNKSDDSTFRVWVAGCSTGEEAYSIAILIRECLDELNRHLTVQIFSTDLDDDAIESGRAGVFPGGISADVSSKRLSQFFIKEDGCYLIRKELRDWLIFAPQNVIHDPPFTKLDLLSCRNLLIYMQPELQKKLLTLFHYSLLPEGCLFLGTSESISEFDDLFQSLDAKAKVFRRKESPVRPDNFATFPVVESTPKAQAERSFTPKDLTAASMRETMTQMLALNFAPPTVVVSEHGEIVHVHGRTGMFLELAPGGPPKNIIAMAREGLELDLTSALRKAALQDAPVVHENVPVKTNGHVTLINLIVQKIAEPESIRGLFRVSFQLIADGVPPLAEIAPGKQPGKQPGKVNKRLTSRERELELELQQTRESLRRMIEELDASNEEMKSTNEELQSTNEELQSTNEELETSKEELQSLNEELQTVNAEFQDKIRDLSTANDDMNNLLNSTEIATIFLDNSLNIKRFTEQARKIVRLIPTDLGRSLRDLTSHLKYDSLIQDSERVLKTLVPREFEVQTDDGHWRLVRIMPYRTSDDRIDGLVMTFVDIDESRRNREQVTSIAENIVATVREPMLVLDTDLRARFANRSFYQTFQTNAAETLGKLVYDLGNRQWNIPGLRKLLEEILPKDRSFEDYEITYVTQTIGPKRMLLNARRLTAGADQTSLILLSMELVSG
jgi:two-component system CheB/CheR fusion protein